MLSDHSAAILSIPKKISKKRRAFRFTNYVVNKEEFLPTVEDLWNKEVNGHKMYRVVQKLKSIKHPMRKLNCKMAIWLIKWMFAESGLVVGFQKANVEWISSGDRNTKYFYKVIARNNEEGIAMNTEKFFINRLFDDEAAKMVIDVTDKEIKEAMFDIGENKAPGLDGFTSAFFKHSWEIIGKEVCQAIKEFFCSGKLLGEINATLITLIPRIPQPNKGYNCKNGASRCALKIDIAKAYDTVDWAHLTVPSTMKTLLGLVLLISKLVVKGQNLGLILLIFFGNGRYISMWNDYWNEMGQLSNFVTNKEIYDARIDENSCVADMIMENEWVWPKNWARKFTQLEKLKCNDSHERLFFKCEFSKTIWDGVKDEMYLGRISNDWGDIVKRIADLPCNNSIRSMLRRFVLATSVYYIWKERNSRLFSSDIKKVDILLHDIKENIILQL
ncbi:hypothetical protein Tco_0783772, partial [Tanacetum coccineum]